MAAPTSVLPTRPFSLPSSTFTDSSHRTCTHQTKWLLHYRPLHALYSTCTHHTKWALHYRPSHALYRTCTHHTKHAQHCLYMIWACFLQHLHTSHKMYATLQVHALYSTYTKSHKCLCFTAPTHITQNVHDITGACSLQQLHTIT